MLHRMFVLLAVALAMPAPAQAQAPAQTQAVTEIILAHNQRQNPFQVPLAATAWRFKDSVESRSGGAIRVQILPENQAGSDSQVPRLVKTNVVQTAFLPAPALAPLYPPIAVTLTPFATASKAHAAAIYDGAFGRSLADDILARTGMAVLGFAVEDGAHVVTNSTTPIQSPADMAGLRLGVPPGLGFVTPMLEAVGANPVKVTRSDAYMALEGRALDGLVGSAEQVIRQRYDDVQTFATITDHRHAPVVWLMNRQTLDALPPEHRAIVQEAAKAALEAGRKLAARQDAELAGSKMLGRNLDVVTLSPRDRAYFAAAIRPAAAAAIEAQLGAEGKEWLQRLIDAK